MAMSASGSFTATLTESRMLCRFWPGLPSKHRARSLVGRGHLEETTQTQGLPSPDHLPQGSIVPAPGETTLLEMQRDAVSLPPAIYFHPISSDQCFWWVFLDRIKFEAYPNPKWKWDFLAQMWKKIGDFLIHNTLQLRDLMNSKPCAQRWWTFSPNATAQVGREKLAGSSCQVPEFSLTDSSSSLPPWSRCFNRGLACMRHSCGFWVQIP